MTEPTVNIPLLRKAVEWAEAEAAKPKRLRQWNQADYAVRPQHVGRAPECGTCYCIAGYVVALDHEITFTGEWDDEAVDGDIEASIPTMAQEKLGLTIGQRQQLFSGTNDITMVRRIAESIAGESL